MSYGQRHRDWPWLDGEDEMFAGAIEDVADVVATACLQGADMEQAIAAGEVALTVSRDSDRMLRQLAKAHQAAEQHGQLQAVLRRLTDVEGDLAPSFVEVARRNGWLAHGA